MKIEKKQTQRAPFSDERIVELYFARDEKAIEETDFKYGKYLFSVAYNVLHDDLDCEECLNDTYLGTWNAIPPSTPRSLRAFLITIIRRLSIKRYHVRSKKSTVPSEMTVSLSELEEFVAGDGDVSPDFDTVKLGRILSEFVRSLSERRQFIFMSRYYVSDPLDKIASDLGVSRSTVSKELAAIRRDLKEILESEGYSI